MMSFPIETNDAVNALNCFKEFCILVGTPKILQTDNGGEYKNNLFKNYCDENNIKHIFSSPYHPESNGIVEVSHKEIRKNVIISYSEHPDNFNLKNVLLDAVAIHNQNIHTSTNYKPIDLLHNSSEVIKDEVMKNIEKNFPKNLNSSENLKVGDKVLIKKNCLKKGKRLITQKYNLRDEKIIATLSNLYTNTLFSIKIDETINTFEEGEELIVNINQILYITDQEWQIIKKDIEKKNLKTS